MSPTSRHYPDLNELIGLFYPSVAALGVFAAAASSVVPDEYRRLLDHNNHMTVTVEAFHRCPVDVRVIDRRVTPTHYARKILLSRQSDGAIVQFGIMRVNLALLKDAVRERILAEDTPLGRILIENDVLRSVRLRSLWQVVPGEELQAYFALPGPLCTYGRTAVIELNEAPAVEVLEIVTPIS